MPRRSGPRLPLAVLRTAAPPTETTPTCTHSRTTYKFIEQISALISPVLTEVQDAPHGSRKPLQGLNPFAREFLLSAPETTIKLLAQLCIAPPPPPSARNNNHNKKKKKKKLELLNLPPEIRLHIYDDCCRARWKKYRRTQELAARPNYIPPILSTAEMWDRFVADATAPLEPTILRVSKLVREEGLAEYVKFLKSERAVLEVQERELKRKVRAERILVGNSMPGQNVYVVSRSVPSYPEKVAVSRTREMMGREEERLARMG
ncbi:hypothetical protein BST61_g4087 [Cercospora zeina]